MAIGRNYAEHAKELNNAVPKEPFFFLKPTTSYVPDGGEIQIPRGIIAHHEGLCRFQKATTSWNQQLEQHMYLPCYRRSRARRRNWEAGARYQTVSS